MAIGIGSQARDDRRYLISTVPGSDYVSGATASPYMAPSPMAGAEPAAGSPTSLWVWGITLAAVAYIVLAHVSLGRR